ncbi:MAG: ATP-binding protein [Bacilli bacterium]|nr:ATP-binding protein [Mollicutes bacterium]MDY3899659.1 ATP-binding protein [Bacilli bacterium]
MNLIKRDLYLKQLINRKENGLIKIITGIRRCGKSYLLFKIFYNYLIELGIKEDNIITLALDDDKNREYRNPDKLSDYLYSRITNKNEMFYIFLDEIQFAFSFKNNDDGYSRVYGILNGLLRLDNVDIYVTGSNSKFLSSDIMTEFRDRGDEVRVYPLSFSEFYSSNLWNDKYEAWNEYTRFGGLPMILTKKTDDEKSNYLKNLLNKTYIQDVIERNNLKGNNIIDTLVDILASSIGSLTNPTKLARTFASNNIKTTDVTLATYIDYLIDAFMINKAQRYDIKGKKYIDSPFKFYFTDIGIRNCRLNYRQQEPTHIMENIIYNELLIRGYNVDVGIIEHTTRNKEGKQKNIQQEVDFICNTADNRYYIQSAFSIPNEEKMIQETSQLDKIGDSFKKIIITQDLGKPWRTDKGYLVINILDFLLNPSSLDI